MVSALASSARDSQRGAWLSLIAYIALAAAKLAVGGWGHSSGLVADGFNNMTDAVAGAAVLFGLRIAVRPPDSDHRYGHARAETVAAMLVAAMMGLIGLNVLVDGARSALGPAAPDAPEPAVVWVGSAAALVMFAVAAANRRLAARTCSQALAAVAHDNLADAYTSLGPVAGVVAARAGWHWADPVVALLIAVVILRTAWQIGVQAAHALMDGFDTESLGQIRSRVLAVPGVTALREARARHLGSGVAVEVTVAVRRSLTVADAHQICDRIEQDLRGFLGISHVHVHVEPD